MKPILNSEKNTETLGIIAITEEPTFSFTLTPQIEKELDKARKSISKRKKDTVVELKKLIQKYPHVTTFYNYLAIAYRNEGKDKEEYELIKATIKKFPNYFFGKITLLSYYVETQNIAELDKLLGNVKSIKDYAPEKEVFHISEISSFYSAYLDYLAYKQETERIKSIWELLEKLAQKFEDLEAKMSIIKTRFIKVLAIARMMEMQERASSIKRVEVISTSRIHSDSDAKSPILNHEKEVKEMCSELFFEITPEQLDAFLSLPKETLVEDLEAILIDIQTRKEIFYDNFENNTELELPYYAIYHTLNFLSVLESKKSLPIILDVFRQDKEFLEFWFEDYLEYSYVGWLLYKFLENDFSTIANFVKEENNEYRVRNGIMGIPAQVALHQPQRRQEVIDFYKDLIHFFIENKDNQNIIEHTVTTYLGSLVNKIEGKELRQDLIELHKAGLINDVIDRLEDILEELDTPFYSIFQSEKINLNLSLLEAYKIIENHQEFTYPKTEEEARKAKEKSILFFESTQADRDFFDIQSIMRSLVQQEEPSRIENRAIIPYQDEDDYEKEVSSFDSYIKNKTSYQRNDKVTVKYKNGKIIENTKYKKVEKDIKEGKCFIV